MTSGFYLMHRGWMENPVFENEPLCKRAAWAWLIENAAHKPVRVRINGKAVILKRGQMSHSVRYLADAWGWSRSTTQRFLDNLADEKMIIRAWDSAGTAAEPENGTASGTHDGTERGTRAGTAQNIITICNYSRFQDTRKKVGTASGTDDETGTGTKRGTVRGTAKVENLGQYTNNTNNTLRDANASADLTKVIFGTCVAFLSANGTSEGAARSFLGGLRKDYSDAEIIETTMAAQREQVVEPRAWIVGRLQHRNPKKTLARSAL